MTWTGEDPSSQNHVTFSLSAFLLQVRASTAMRLSPVHLLVAVAAAASCTAPSTAAYAPLAARRRSPASAPSAAAAAAALAGTTTALRSSSGPAFPERGGGTAPPGSGRVRRMRDRLPSSESAAARALAAAAATVAAHRLNNCGPWGLVGPAPALSALGVWGAGPVMGSAAIALAAAILLGPGRPALQLSALCGSFAGMARLAVVPGFASSAVLGAACALALAAFDRGGWLVGRGGRLGFIAQVACTGTYLLLRYGVPLLPAPFGGFLGTGTLASGPSALIDRAMYGDLPSWIGTAAAEAAWPLIPSAVLGAFAMRAWMAAARGAEDVVGGEGPAGWAARRLGTPTAAVGATGALSALLLPPAGAGMAYVGSFVAMSAPSVLGGGWALGLASALSAVAWAIPMKGLLLGGWGGKMGTAALVGVLSYDALRPVVDRATGGFRREGGDEDKES